MTVPLADIELKRAVRVIRPLHGLQNRDKWNLLAAVQGQEAPPREDFEKNAALSRDHVPAVGLREREEQVRRRGGRERGKGVSQEEEGAALSSLVSSLTSSCSPRRSTSQQMRRRRTSL